MSGFRGQTINGIPLAVDQTVRLPITLMPGVVEQSVEVTAAAPLVDSSTSSLGQVIDNKKIVDLPLNGRNPFTLGLLSGFSAPVKGVASNLPFVAGGGVGKITMSSWMESTTTRWRRRVASA